MGIAKVYRRVSKDTIDLLSTVKTIEEVYDILSKRSVAVDIDKTWELIHYLLTDSKYPDGSLLSKIIYPEHSTLQFENDEYDEARRTKNEEKIQEFHYRFSLSISYLKPKEISLLLDEMKRIDIEERMRNQDIEEINKQDIYPGFWTLDEKDSIEYLKIHYEILINFMDEAKKNGEYLLVS